MTPCTLDSEVVVMDDARLCIELNTIEMRALKAEARHHHLSPSEYATRAVRIALDETRKRSVGFRAPVAAHDEVAFLAGASRVSNNEWMARQVRCVLDGWGGDEVAAARAMVASGLDSLFLDGIDGTGASQLSKLTACVYLIPQGIIADVRDRVDSGETSVSGVYRTAMAFGFARAYELSRDSEGELPWRPWAPQSGYCAALESFIGG
jgi:hypothetical protein